MNEIIKAGERMFKQKSKLNGVPILMFQAGNDAFVRSFRQSKTCHSLDTCQLIRYDKAKHEILQENDSIRNDAINRIRQFITSK